MLSFQESRNFIWYTSQNDELGRGSFGIVFRGFDKRNGTPVAAKVPHSNVTIPEEVEKREIEVCGKITHPNIVQLLGYEEAKTSLHRNSRPPKVLIMELCDGGSLYKILDHPMNHFGVEETEFLNVLRDLTAAMKYMRENGIIHRDLKPANIMRCICDDGSTMYKITDFGAARELVDNQEYSSIYGTEEYLHPDVYEQALLPNGNFTGKKRFSPSTDLWSIGATLYHVATGMLPFRPNGGRKDRKIMHLMTTKKNTGVISAHQPVGDNEKIVFEEQLPKTCLLSPALRKLICPLLAGLMEVDPRKKLSFENYFLKVEDILNRKKLNLFYFNKLQSIRLFVDPENTKTFNDLATVIFENTKVPPEHQILLFKDTTLKDLLESQSNVTNICSKLPETDESNPVILCNRIDDELSLRSSKSSFKKKSFPNIVDYQRDAQIATHNCLVAFYIKRQIIANCSKASLIESAVQTINQVVVQQLTAVSKQNTLINKSVNSMRNQFEMMHIFYVLCTQFGKLVPEDIGEPDESEGSTGTFHERVRELETLYSTQFSQFKKLEQLHNNLRPSIESLLGSRVQNRVLMNSWETAVSQVKGVSDFRRIQRIVETLVSSIEQSYGDFTGDLSIRKSQQLRAPLPDEECLHLIERTKMLQTMDKLDRTYEECLTNVKLFNNVVSDWYKQAKAALIQPEILASDIVKLQEKMSLAESALADAVGEFKIQLEKVTASLSVFPVVAGSIQNSQNHGRAAKAKAVRERLHELAKVQEEIQSKFKVNSDLCTQLQGLMNSFSDPTA